MEIIKRRFLRAQGTKSVVRAEISVDTADELPEADGIAGVILAQDSTAHVINDGDVYALNSAGEWKLQGG